MNKRKWIAFFSQTGGEIADLSEKLGRWPDLIITNRRPSNLRTIDSRIVEKQHELLTVVENKPTVDIYKALIYDKDAITTLHGWLRVMPGEICDQYEIYNGHPGLITEFPELKGKDPQVRAIQGNYEKMGCVLHEVTAGVDEGQVIKSASFQANILTEDEIWSAFRETSLTLWKDFMVEKLDNN